MDSLNFCLECDNGNTCRKCVSDFFKIHEDGTCTCRGGKNAIFNPRERECKCKPNYFMTTEGCRKCDEAIPHCSKCFNSTDKTQIKLANSSLDWTGNYLKCESCPYTTFMSTRGADGSERSDCIKCSDKFQGCINCDSNGCARCTNAYLRENNVCVACSTYRPECEKCEKNDYC